MNGALTYTAEEMGIILRKSAYSPNIRERMDHSCALFDEKERMIAQAEHIPVHLGSMPLALSEGLRTFGEGLEEGDMLFFNDPYVAGTHLPDLTLVAPICFGNERVGYAVNKAHHSDVGGRAPGSMASDSTELYQEGLIIPPVKLLKRGVLDSELTGLIEANVRTPHTRLGDIRAQIAANLTGEKRVKELIERVGIEPFRETVEEILNYSERRMRTELRKMPEGTWAAEDSLEDIGPEGHTIKIRAAVTVKQGNVHVDFDGTDEQVEAPMNAVLGVTLSAVYYVLRCVTDPTIPANEGHYRPVSVNVPEGSILNPHRPAAVAGGNVETSQRIVDVLLRAFAESLPKRACAASQGTMNNVSIGGYDLRSGGSWTFYETVAGGMGGRYGADGLDGVHTNMTNTLNTPIEVIEASYPLRCLRYALRPGSGGAGRWRGGLGLERVWLFLAPATISILAERNKIAPWGLFGGRSGATGEYLLLKKNGRKIRLKSKATIKAEKGDTLIMGTPGGGGYEDPSKRSQDLVEKDLAEGLVKTRRTGRSCQERK